MLKQFVFPTANYFIMSRNKDEEYFSFPPYVTPPCSPPAIKEEAPEDVEPATKNVAPRQAGSRKRLLPPGQDVEHQDKSVRLELLPNIYAEISKSNLLPGELQTLQRTTNNTVKKTFASMPSIPLLQTGVPQLSLERNIQHKSLNQFIGNLPASHHISLPHPSPVYTRPESEQRAKESVSARTEAKISLAATSSGALCTICGDQAGHHLHYGAVACFSCRQFFRRGRPRGKKCVNDIGDCDVNKYNRTNCKYCR